jgi:hypothetical protein
MIGITTLWLPILLSAIGVFIASSIIHMVLGYHGGDFKKLPDEAKLLETMRDSGVAPGDYAFPCPSSRKEMGSPEMKEKWAKGPVGSMIVIPNGPPAMGKALGWSAWPARPPSSATPPPTPARRSGRDAPGA